MSRMEDDTMAVHERKEDTHVHHAKQPAQAHVPVHGVRRSGSTRVVAPPPPNHGTGAASTSATIIGGVAAIAASSSRHKGHRPHAHAVQGASRTPTHPHPHQADDADVAMVDERSSHGSTMKKRSLASFQQQQQDTTAMVTPAHHYTHPHHHHQSHGGALAADERERNKRVKMHRETVTPSQIVADELAQVRLLNRSTLAAASSSSAAAAAAAAAAPASAVSLPPSDFDLLSPVTAPSTTTSSGTGLGPGEEDDFACEEELDDSDQLSPSSSSAMALASEHDHLLTAGPSPAGTTTIVRTPGGTQTSISLHPSIWRSYHSRQPLLVSVETALDEFNPDLELQMWNAEQEFQPYLYYLIYQTQLDSNMRPVLIDWLQEVAGEYCLARETVYLAINYIDRFLSLSPTNLPADGTAHSVIDRKNLQLLGVTCLWIASKVEEIFPPTPDDLATTTDHAFDAKQLVQMEPVVLRVLGWRLHAQTPYAWLKIFLKKSAMLLYDEFKRRAQLLFAATMTPSSAAAAAASPNDAYMPNTPECAAAGLDPGTALTPSQAHSQFALLQLDFLHEMEYLLSAAWFIRMMEWLDVVALDMHSLRFYPSQWAAAVLFVVHPPSSALHELISAATTYTSAQLKPAIDLVKCLQDMPYRGPPEETKRSILLDLKIPYDEFHSRQVHNPDALQWINAALEKYARDIKEETRRTQQEAAAAAAAAAASAASSGATVPSVPVPPVDCDDGLEAYCHTNIFRNLPSFLDGALWSELHARGLLRPIQNGVSHRLPGLWVTDVHARHDDPTTFAPAGLPEATGLEGYIDEAAAQAIVAAARQSKISLDILAVAPHTDSFVAAARKPYTRLPKDAIRAGDRAAAAAAAAASHQAVEQAAGIQHRSSSSASLAAAAAAASSSSSTLTLYPFGGGPPAAAATSTSTAAPAAGVTAGGALAPQYDWDSSASEGDEAI